MAQSDGGWTRRLLGGYHDRGHELREHRLFVGFVMTGKDQQRGDDPDQPAAAPCHVRRVVGAERIDECVGQGGDHVGLLGQFSADRRGCRRGTGGPPGGAAERGEGGGGGGG